MKKSFKIITVSLAVLSITSLAVLIGCNNKQNGDNGKTNHTHNFIASVTEPTCTERGYTTHACECGESYTDSYVSATDHTPKAAVKENEVDADCTVDGGYDEVVRCSVCNETISSTHKTTEKTGHNYDGGICLNCGELQTEELAFTMLSDGTYRVARVGAKDVDIIIPSEYKGVKVTAIADDAFKNSNIKNVTIPDSVTSIGREAFYGCNELTGIYYQGNIAGWCAMSRAGTLTIYSDANDGKPILYINSKELSGELIIPDGVTSIGGYAFSYCRGLTSVTIPDSVTSIGGYAFCDCRGLTGVTIPDSVTSIGGYAFYNCYNLAGVTIPDSVTSVGDLAFYNCNKMTSIIIPDSVTHLGNSTFYHCSGLTAVTIGSGVTSIGNNAFYNCNSLTSVIIPDGVTDIGDDAFGWCVELTDITIPEGVTSIGSRAFVRCNSLTGVTIPNSVTSIGDYAFRECSKLTEITIPDGVAAIGKYTFWRCGSLNSITIPESVTVIDEQAFAFCDGLRSVYYKGTEESWDNISIGLENTELIRARHYYYSETQPNTDGNYWHYKDGEIVVWTKTED